MINALVETATYLLLWGGGILGFVVFISLVGIVTKQENDDEV